MEKLLTVVLLNLSLLSILAVLTGAFVSVRCSLHAYWLRVPAALQIAWWFIQGFGCLWTLYWAVTFLRSDLWTDGWPISGWYWAYATELRSWLQIWCSILIPSIPALATWSTLGAEQYAQRNPASYARLTARTLGSMLVILGLVTPLVAFA